MIEIQVDSRVYLDASPIIYSVEKIAPYDAMLRSLWQSARQEQIQLCGSHLLLLETLVRPLQSGHEHLANAFRQLLTAREFDLYPISWPILERAAHIRATYRFKTPDAIHLATAIEANADAFITNDSKLHRFTEIEVIILNDFLPHITQ